MMHHSKGLDLEITDSEYRRDQTNTGEITLSQTSTLNI